MNFAKAHDSYLNPPDEPEAVHCDDCGEEMEEGHLTGNMICGNVFCPSKFFDSTVREMANELVEALAEVKSLAKKLKYKTRELDRIVEVYSNSGLE